MRVRFNTSVSTIGGGYPEGSVATIPDAQAKQWVKNGWCSASKDEETSHVSRVELSKTDEEKIKAAAKFETLKGRRATAKAEAAAKARSNTKASAGK